MSRRVERPARVGEPRDGRRGGFSLVELLLVMVIIGVLAQIVVPNFRNVTIRARAVDLMSRIETVETAGRNYQSDNFAWPAEAGTGEIPSGMETYLPDGFSFTGEDFQLDWENLEIPGGLPQNPGTNRLVGVAVVTDNESLGQALVDVFGTAGWFNVGNSYTFIVER